MWGCAGEDIGSSPLSGTAEHPSTLDTSTAGAGTDPEGPPTAGAGPTAGSAGGSSAADHAPDAGTLAPPAEDGGTNAGTDAATGPEADAAAEHRTDAATGPAVDAGTPTITGPDQWAAGDYPPDLLLESYLEIAGVPGQNGYTRQYKVHVPPGYDPQTPAPLVLCIHGLGQTPVLFCLNGAQMHVKSDQEGFILVMPLGYLNSWNAGTCCGGASTEQLDDVALMRAILEEVGTHLNVDPDRIYATGLSNGGYMSYRLACEAADVFAAVAPAAGAVGINSLGGGSNPTSDFVACEPSQPISVLDVHGTTDPLVPYTMQAPTVELMRDRDGCEATTTAATQPASGGDTTCVTYAGCPDGIELIACSVDNGGHCWFGSPDCGTGTGALGMIFVGNNSNFFQHTDAVWDFFARIHR